MRIEIEHHYENVGDEFLAMKNELADVRLDHDSVVIETKEYMLVVPRAAIVGQTIIQDSDVGTTSGEPI